MKSANITTPNKIDTKRVRLTALPTSFPAVDVHPDRVVLTLAPVGPGSAVLVVVVDALLCGRKECLRAADIYAYLLWGMETFSREIMSP